MEAEAFAKVNLSLRVRPRDESGLHPLLSLMQSIDWSDRLEWDASDEDHFEVVGPAPAGEDNLAWTALAAVRSAVGERGPVTLRLRKSIPVAAGLGGASADAAAVLRLAQENYGISDELAAQLAPDIGADVPFSLVGGLALVEGYGEKVTPVATPPGDFVLGLVVPPVELATGDVYARWDDLDRVEGPVVEAPAVPPSLRARAPLVNDLYAAAVAIAPNLDAWRAELVSRWDRPVAMSGSGPSLFAFFLDGDEAGEATALIPTGARAAGVARLVSQGCRVDGGTLA